MVSTAGVTIAVAAMVIVMSVFNGFHALIDQRLSTLDPPLIVLPSKGKTIADADSLARQLTQLPQVSLAYPIIHEKALAATSQRQATANLYGVPVEQYLTRFDSITLAGDPWADYHPAAPPAVVSVGLANSLLLPIATEQLLTIHTPKRLGRINPASPLSAFRTDSLAPSAAFALNQPEYDRDALFAPIATVRQLLQYTPAQATEIHLYASPTKSLIKQISSILPDDTKLLTRQQLLAGTFQIVNIERYISLLLLALILGIASFNIISSLSLLIIEKQPNAQTLRAIGTTPKEIRQIYIACGIIITAAGTLLGIALGSLLSLAQQHLHLIKLTGDPAEMSVTSYPVQLNPLDLIPITLIALAIGLLTSIFATRNLQKQK